MRYSKRKWRNNQEDYDLDKQLAIEGEEGEDDEEKFELMSKPKKVDDSEKIVILSK
jgi:hypothetical protein